jgi:hypothetical protein
VRAPPFVRRVSAPGQDPHGKKVGVYDRPASADRKRGPWIWAIAILVALAWMAYFFLWRS